VGADNDVQFQVENPAVNSVAFEQSQQQQLDQHANHTKTRSSNQDASTFVVLGPEQIKVDEVYKILVATPLWECLDDSVKGNAAREQININFSKIALYETSVIRDAVEAYLSQCFGGKNYNPKLIFSVYSISILNRFIFNVPEIITRKELDKLPFYFVGMTLPHDEINVNLLWPVTRAKDGSLKLTGFMETYSGPQAQPLSEFDIFNKTFGRRKRN